MITESQPYHPPSVDQEGIDRLNVALDAAPLTVKALLLSRLPCSDELAELVFHQEDENGYKFVTALGLLNATVFQNTSRLGRVTTARGDSTFAEQDEGFEGFGIWTPPTHPLTEVTP